MFIKICRRNWKNIAKIFYEAEKAHAILVLEEADSFIPNRGNISNSWGITQVNEFIVSLELNRGICICTTNRIKSLDSAVMRRFGLKVEFLYAKPEQLILLYNKILAPLVSEKCLKNLKRNYASKNSSAQVIFKPWNDNSFSAKKDASAMDNWWRRLLWKKS